MLCVLLVEPSVPFNSQIKAWPSTLVPIRYRKPLRKVIPSMLEFGATWIPSVLKSVISAPVVAFTLRM